MYTSILKTMSPSGWMRSLVALLFITFFMSNVKAQQKQAGGNDEIYTAVDHPAEFPGGIKTFSEYLAKNMRYPADARKNGVQGRVFLTFVVEKDGGLSDIKVMRRIGSGCDEEAVRVMKSSPKCKSGMQNDQAVRQQYNMPISFTLAKAVSKP